MSESGPSPRVPTTPDAGEVAAKPRPRAALEAIEPGKEPDVVANAGRMVLALGALGIVFGDIGTSPLYTAQVLFTYHAARQVNSDTVYGLTH